MAYWNLWADKLPSRPNLPSILTGTSIFVAGFVVHMLVASRKSAGVIESPRTTLLPALSAEEQGNLPYPPDALPGARDVRSPYGTIRVYEWGPEDGRKVLLVHGISTPCLALAPVAHGLVARGCRIMLFDLFGRGYSDTPADLNHDVRLFSTQILLALTSSPLSWTGEASGGFALLGYSLGGGISVDFVSYFPDLVNALILVAPSGLIRPHHISRVSRIIYSEGVIPEPILNRAVRRRLRTPLPPPKPKKAEKEDPGVLDPVRAEVNIEPNSTAVFSKTHPNVTIESAVAHQVENHEGFVHAFMSSIRHGPIMQQHQYWQIIGQRLTQQKAGSGNPGRGRLHKSTVLVICGKDDTIIKKDELVADGTEALHGNVEFRFIDAGHEAPVTRSDEVIKYIMEFWG